MIDKDLLNKIENTGFIKHNNYEIIKIDNNEVILKTPLTENTLNPYGIGHGGFIFGLGDTAMGIMAIIDGRRALTVDANTSFIKPAKGEYLLAKGKVIKYGESISFLEATIYDDNNDIVAKMSSRYFYIK